MEELRLLRLVEYVGCLMHRLILTVVLFVSAVMPVSANDEKDCFQQTEPQLRIKGCSEIILRKPDDATAYHNRAVAYGLAGEVDHAIADYTKTVEMRPDNAAAYENRGRAYASKGDYTNAVADAMKASELGSNTATRISATTFTSPKAGAATPKNSKAVTVLPTPRKRPLTPTSLLKKLWSRPPPMMP